MRIKSRFIIIKYLRLLRIITDSAGANIIRFRENIKDFYRNKAKSCRLSGSRCEKLHKPTEGAVSCAPHQF